MFHSLFLLFLQISELEFVIGFGSFIFLLLAIFVAVFLIAAFRRKRKHQQHLIQLENEKQQELLQTQIEIQEQTLNNISQEIHDNIGQVLSLAKLNLNTIPANIEEELFTKINKTKELVSKAIHDLRDLSRSMHGDRIAELGLKDAIENELTILQNTGQYKTYFIVSGNYYKLPRQKEIVVFRMLQESINNSIKHARAQNITVEMNYQPQSFQLWVSDDGRGFDAAALAVSEKGIGLKSMHNRAALIGAVFSIQSSPFTGTTVTIKIAGSIE
jgi:signal transduction histidine kinase